MESWLTLVEIIISTVQLSKIRDNACIYTAVLGRLSAKTDSEYWPP